MIWRTRLDRLEARLPHPSGLTAEQRAGLVERLLGAANQPDASPDLRARVDRVRELLALAESRLKLRERGIP